MKNSFSENKKKAKGVRWKEDMEKIVYITEDERKKCGNIVDAYAELIKGEDMAVLDAGKYGYVKLRYYDPERGFDTVETFVSSEELFNNLWEEWLDIQLFSLVQGTPMAEMRYEDIFCSLPREEQEKLLDMRHYFEERAKGGC